MSDEGKQKSSKGKKAPAHSGGRPQSRSQRAGLQVRCLTISNCFKIFEKTKLIGAGMLLSGYFVLGTCHLRVGTADY
jgi:hypothetical protein